MPAVKHKPRKTTVELYGQGITLEYEILSRE